MHVRCFRQCLRIRRQQVMKALAAGICLLSVFYFLLPHHLRQDAKRPVMLLARQEVEDTNWVQRVRLHRGPPNQTCVHPSLDPFEPSVMQFYRQEPRVDCSAAMDDWVSTTNGTFRISPRARRLHGRITCEYAPLLRVDDFSARHGPHVKPMLDGTPLQSDFFKVACVSTSGRRYLNVHSGVAWNKKIHERLQKFAAREAPGAFSSSSSSSSSSSMSAGGLNLSSPHSSPLQVPGLNLSVFIFGFDSMSRMSWIRLLPRTRHYFLHALGGLELEGYNIVGDGTPAALLPILTGRSEEELPETRRGFPGAEHVDGHPWVWKEFRRHGYVTAYAEDMASIGTFQLRMLGFKEQPTDHCMRLFYLAAERLYKNNVPLCLGSKPRHVNFMNWFEELFDMYRNHPKFFFGFHSEMSHDRNNPLQALDLDLTSFLQRLEEKGHLNSTLLILMADHGARFSYVRATAQGKLEERMPYFAFRFPPWLKRIHPQLVRNFQSNTHRLTTPFDVHQTLLEVLAYTGSGVADVSQRAVSLFKEIPQSRTCSHAGVTPHWCACLNWLSANMSDSVVRSAVETALAVINSYTEQNRSACAQLELREITRAARYTPSREDYLAEQRLRAYSEAVGQIHKPLTSQSADPGLPDSLHEIYQVSFVTTPGNGHFEVTCTLDVSSGTFSVASTDISRINTYGTHPDCIAGSTPHLRPYCYCI